MGHGRRGQLCMHATAGRRQGPGGRREAWPVGRADGRAGSRVGRGGRAVGSGGAGAPGGTGGTGGRTRGVHALRLRGAAPLSARRGRAESASSDAGLRAATPGHTTAPGGDALVWARRLARGRRPRVGIERRGAPPGGHPLYKPPLPTTRHPTGRCTGSPPLQTDQRMIHRVTNVGVRGGGGARAEACRAMRAPTRGARRSPPPRLCPPSSHQRQPAAGRRRARRRRGPPAGLWRRRRRPRRGAALWSRRRAAAGIGRAWTPRGDVGAATGRPPHHRTGAGGGVDQRE